MKRIFKVFSRTTNKAISSAALAFRRGSSDEYRTRRWDFNFLSCLRVSIYPYMG